MIGIIFAASVALAQGAPAAASAMVESTAPSSTVSPVTVASKRASSKGDGSEMVCRTEPVLGTLFPKRICARRDEVAARTRLDQKEVREMTNLRPYISQE